MFCFFFFSSNYPSSSSITQMAFDLNISKSCKASSICITLFCCYLNPRPPREKKKAAEPCLCFMESWGSPARTGPPKHSDRARGALQDTGEGQGGGSGCPALSMPRALVLTGRTGVCDSASRAAGGSPAPRGDHPSAVWATGCAGSSRQRCHRKSH